MKAILACDDSWGIGRNGSLPWPKFSDDLRFFKQTTHGKIVVMGRGTWDSHDMPSPLPGRRNIVITNRKIDGVESYTLDDFKERILPNLPEEDMFLIGGAGLLGSLIDDIDGIYLSRIKGKYKCDTFLPKELIESKFTLKWANATFSGFHVQYWGKI